MKAAKILIDSLFMFEPKQNDLDPNLLFAKCIHKIDNTFWITIAKLSNRLIVLLYKSEY